MPARRALAYGLLGLPLAFAALPVYVHVPRLYAETAGLPLALLGAILLGARLLDAGIDPWLGWLADRLPRRQMVALALLPLALLAGFLEPVMTPAALKSLSAVGNILIFCVGTNLFGLPHVRVANLLPALVIAVIWVL